LKNHSISDYTVYVTGIPSKGIKEEELRDHFCKLFKWKDKDVIDVVFTY